MISIKSRVIINKNIQTASGMLYERTKVKIVDINDDNIQVSDMAGRLFWVKRCDILM